MRANDWKTDRRKAVKPINQKFKGKQTSDNNDSWGSRPVGWFRELLPWITVILILLGGYMSVSLIKPLLPDYRDELVSFEKAEQNSPIYL